MATKHAQRIHVVAIRYRPTAGFTGDCRLMSTGNPLLDIVLVALVFVWIFGWIYSLTSRSYAKRNEPYDLTPVRPPRSSGNRATRSRDQHDRS
jgi:hypothetical protein